MADSNYKALPTVADRGRDWTPDEIAAFPLWAKVCHVVHGFNTHIQDFEDWMGTFGGDWSEWPEDLRVRQFPEAAP